MTRVCSLILALLLGLVSPVVAVSEESRGYLNRPPIFIGSFHDFPLAGMGIEMPPPDKISFAVDFDSLESDGFRRNGQSVQPGLSVKYDTVFVGGLYGINRDWAAELVIPWQRVRVRGEIGGLPASSSIESLGGIIVGAKRLVWSDAGGQRIVATGLIQFPTGRNNATFDQSNAATNGYYSGFSQRMPLSWQPSSGTVNGYLSLAYGRAIGRFSFAAIAATKLHTSNDEDVKIGDVFVLAGAGTYGITERLAVSLTAALRMQAEDSYPEAPSPGVDQPLLTGTTQHGSTLYVEPSFRFVVFRSIAIGLGVRLPVVKPDDGLVPDARLDIIFYPGF